jgi:hypothetical protein
MQKFEVRYVIEEVFNCPEIVVASDRDSTAIWAIECAGIVANSHVDVAKPRGR